MFPTRSFYLHIYVLTVAGLCHAQTSGATFGDVIGLGGTPSDIVLDQTRGRLYLVNANTNQVNIYDYNLNGVVGSINVGSTPLAAAISMDGHYLYVTNNLSASVSVIDLTSSAVVQTVNLPANPEGVEVGSDGRAL